MTALANMKKQKKVIGLNNNSLSLAIKLFLKEKAEKSENTARMYENHIEEFFMFATGKGIDEVTWEDILNITYTDTKLFVEYLKDKKNSNKTINYKIASLRSLYKELYKTNRKIDLVVVDVNKLPVNEKEDNSYGSLTEEEVEKLYEFALKEKCNPLTKRMFFEVAIVTAIRKSALLNLKWKDIKLKKDKTGVEVWTINVKDKGKYDVTPISNELAERLFELKKVNKATKEDKVFPISDKSLIRTLKRFCKAEGISEERNIVLHSLKKASMDIVYQKTRDIKLTARHGHHSSLEMSYKHYLGKNQSLIDRPSYSLFEKKLDINILEKATKEEIIQVIKQCDYYIINEIILKLEGRENNEEN